MLRECENNTIDYNKKLLKLIEKLKYYPSKSGGEGSAFFIDNDFIVKKFHNSNICEESSLLALFEKYCEEVHSFAQRGFSVADFYAWTKVPYYDYFNFYILEQRVKGIEMSFKNLEDIYFFCDKKFSPKKFIETLQKPSLNVNAYCEIMRSYLQLCIHINTLFLSMPQKELEKFAQDMYTMLIDGKYCYPDFFPSNALIDENSITLIDPEYGNIYDEFSVLNTEMDYDGLFIGDMLNFLSGNSNIYRHFSYVTSRGSEVLARQKFGDLFDENYRLSLECAKRMVKCINNACDKPSVKSLKMSSHILSVLDSFLTKYDANEVAKIIPNSFEK